MTKDVKTPAEALIKRSLVFYDLLEKEENELIQKYREEKSLIGWERRIRRGLTAFVLYLA